MTLKLGEIYAAKIKWRQSEDMRPCIVLSPSAGGLVSIAPISAAMDLYDRNVHFKIADVDPDFPQTGLKRSSFVAGDRIQDIEVTRLLKRLGSLNGKLAQEFFEWLG